jgi:hypothetical protein
MCVLGGILATCRRRCRPDDRAPIPSAPILRLSPESQRSQVVVTFAVFVGGEQVLRIVGAKPKATMVRELAGHL